MNHLNNLGHPNHCVFFLRTQSQKTHVVYKRNTEDTRRLPSASSQAARFHSISPTNAGGWTHRRLSTPRPLFLFGQTYLGTRCNGRSGGCRSIPLHGTPARVGARLCRVSCAKIYLVAFWDEVVLQEHPLRDELISCWCLQQGTSSTLVPYIFYGERCCSCGEHVSNE